MYQNRDLRMAILLPASVRYSKRAFPTMCPRDVLLSGQFISSHAREDNVTQIDLEIGPTQAVE
jgi:hypothetical protein